MLTKVINAFGGPGAGKSTLCFQLAGLMKSKGISCELVTEQAKILTWSNRHTELAVQPYVFGKQLKMIEILQGKVQYIITDSPILLSYVYMGKRWPQSFKEAVLDIFNSYSNYNLMLTPGKDYDPNGRNQTEDEAYQIYIDVLYMLVAKDIPFIQLNYGQYNVNTVFNMITEMDGVKTC